MSADEDATAQALAARRRHAATRWDRVPEHLGIEVVEGPVAVPRPHPEAPPHWLHVVPGRAVVTLVGGTRVEITNGSHATVDLPEHVRESGDSGWVTQGWTVALAMLQRGHLLIHGSAVQIGDAAVCVAGQSGAGKSTTALGLRSRGHRLLVDDVCVIDWPSDASQPVVLPYLRGVHLTRSSAEALGVDFEGLPPLSAGRAKATFFAEDPGPATVPLATVVVVEPSADVDRIVVEEPVGAERLRVLAPHLARDGAAAAILGASRHFALSAKLAGAVRVVRLQRPASDWTLGSVLDAVEGLHPGRPVDAVVRSSGAAGAG